MPLNGTNSLLYGQPTDSQTHGSTASVNNPHHNVSNISVPAGCVLIQLMEFIPWDNPDNIVSAEVEQLTHKFMLVAFLPILFLFGCPANIINMTVFYKQGLNERINVCLFALSTVDGLYMLGNMVYYGEQIQIQFTTKENYGPLLRFMTNHNLQGFFVLTWISQLISAIIALDRCFCILHPLRSQSILSASAMKVIIVFITIVTAGLFFFSVSRYRIGCAYEPQSGNSFMTFVAGEIYMRHKEFLDALDYIVFGTGLPVLAIIVVITTTIITAIKLREAATWRTGSSSGQRISQRDIALTKMLVFNSTFFIICVFPFALIKVLFLFMPEINAGRRHHNFYILVHSFMVMGSHINSSFNIVIYYTMGSRYRQTFRQLFRCRMAKPNATKVAATEITKPSITATTDY